MGNSLQDQLFKAGIASKKQAVKAKKAKNTKEKQQRKGMEVTDETAEQVAKADAEKREKDRALNQQQHDAAQARAIKAQIVQLVELNRIEERGESEFRFTHGETIKTLLLDDETRALIVKGNLCVVCVNDQYDVVPHTVAAKIAERDDTLVLVANKVTEDDTDENDPYADFKVPDDLMW